MPIAVWPVHRLYPSNSILLDRPSFNFDNTKVVYDTSTRVQSRLFQLLYSYHSFTILLTLQLAVAPLTLSLKTNPWKVSPIRRFDWCALHSQPRDQFSIPFLYVRLLDFPMSNSFLKKKWASHLNYSLLLLNYFLICIPKQRRTHNENLTMCIVHSYPAG